MEAIAIATPSPEDIRAKYAAQRAEQDAYSARWTDEPTVGMGATEYGYSDRRACTVVEVKRTRAGKIAWVRVQQDAAELLNGVTSGEPDALKFSAGGFCGHTSGVQRWRTEPDPNGSFVTVSPRVIDGKVFWCRRGGAKHARNDVRFGNRSHHYDFNF